MKYLGEISSFLREKTKGLKPVGNFLRHPIEYLVKHSSSYNALQSERDGLNERVTGLEGQVSGLTTQVLADSVYIHRLEGRVDELKGYEKLAEEYAKRVNELTGLVNWRNQALRGVRHENELLADEVNYWAEGLKLEKQEYREKLNVLYLNTAQTLAVLRTDSPALMSMFRRVYLSLLKRGVELKEIIDLKGNYGRLRARCKEAMCLRKPVLAIRIKA